jgi:hypothetical protein
MAFVLLDGDRAPGDFTLAAAADYTPSGPEHDCLQRINGFVTALLEKFPSETADKELIKERDACIAQLRACAQDLVSGTTTATAVFLTTFQYAGRFEERIARVLGAAWKISPEHSSIDPQIFLDIRYEIGQGTTTSQQLDLKRSLDEAVTVVKVVLAANSYYIRAKRHEYIRALVNIARTGLTEDRIQLASNTLDTLRAEFVAREAGRVKNHYVRRLGLWSAAFIIPFTFIYLYIRQKGGINPQFDWHFWLTVDTSGNSATHYTIYRLRNFLPLAIGASFSAWLAFLIRRPTLLFPELVQLDDDLLYPVTRVLFTIGLAFVVGLLFWTGLVSITVGTFSTQFENSGTRAMLIGVFCGIASRALATAVSRRAEEFAANVGTTSRVVPSGQAAAPAQ